MNKEVKKKFDEMANQIKELNLRVASLEGRNLRTENELSTLKVQVEDLTCRSMNSNVIFHGLDEEQKEDTKTKIETFLHNKLNIPADSIGRNKDISIDIAHRLGKYEKDRKRPIVAMFTTRSAAEYVRSQAKELTSKDYRISEQLPRETRARRMAQIERLKQLKQEYPNKSTKLVRDKLIHDNKVIPNTFSKNQIRINPNVKPVAFDEMVHTKELVESKSRFQGHGLSVGTLVDVQAAINALYQDGTTASSTHIIYAYRIKDEMSGITFSGHNDDGEWGAAASLASYLDTEQYTSTFVAVSRTYGGIDLGQRRFTIIKKIGEEAARLVTNGQNDENDE